MLSLDLSSSDPAGSAVVAALAMSAATGTAFRADGFRAVCEKVGLLRRHVAAVRAAAAVCGAELDGVDVGSTAFSYRPGKVTPGDYRFAVGAAGGVVPVLQAVLPPLMFAGGASTVIVEGGTHVADAPPPEFLERSLLPVLAAAGLRATVVVERAGFSAAAGGRVVATVQPAEKLAPVSLLERGEPTHRLCRAAVAGLSGEIALRELEVVKRMMDWPPECFQIRQLPEAEGPGNVVLIELGNERVTEVFAACGVRGTSAESVADAVLKQAKHHLACGAAVGRALGDALLVPLALADGGAFVTETLNPQTLGLIEVVRKFGGNVTTAEVGKGRCRVEVAGR